QIFISAHPRSFTASIPTFPFHLGILKPSIISHLLLNLHAPLEPFRFRYNARGFDLNRNFPDYFKQNNKRAQPETEAVKEWVSKIQFALSGGLHGGALVASYPFDNTPNSSNSRVSRVRGDRLASRHSAHYSGRTIYAPMSLRRCGAKFRREEVRENNRFRYLLSELRWKGLRGYLTHLFQSYSSTPSLTPDDDVFKHLALTYAGNHPTMHRGVACKPGTPAFESGITNGASWYPLTGGMQDFNYVWYGCMEVTIEMSCCKYPPAKELPQFWEENRVSLVKFLAEVHRGVHGFVMDENGNPVEKASLKIKSRDVGFQTTKYGEFWRILLPGMYKLEVYAEGYIPREMDFGVVADHPTLLNITLHPSKVRWYPPLRKTEKPKESRKHAANGSGVGVETDSDGGGDLVSGGGDGKVESGEVDEENDHGISDGREDSGEGDAKGDGYAERDGGGERGGAGMEPYAFYSPGPDDSTFVPTFEVGVWGIRREEEEFRMRVASFTPGNREIRQLLPTITAFSVLLSPPASPSSTSKQWGYEWDFLFDK
ncbi:hypothetical protein J437_LFUL014493, partial [Ladona fulva]